MRTITVSAIADAVEALCKRVCIELPEDTRRMLENALLRERSPHGKRNLTVALENAQKARENRMPICQDTGMVTVFAEIGQDVHLEGGLFEDAVQEGVRRAYKPFRKSVLTPLTRQNTGDNTPAVIHTRLVEGDHVRLLVAPKGFGSENMSALKMVKPSEGMEGVKRFIVETVVGVGIGGTMEKAAVMAKHALAKAVPASDPALAELEKELLERINRLGIGPQGMGGTVTALNVFIEAFPTHIAGLPVAVNMQCHCARHGEVLL